MQLILVSACLLTVVINWCGCSVFFGDAIDSSRARSASHELPLTELRCLVYVFQIL